MHLDSKQIKDNFSRFSNIYDENTNIQQKSAQNLVTESLKYLKITPDSQILDLGSGTGNVSKFILENQPEGTNSVENIINCDFSLSMLKSSRTKANKICADMCNLPLKRKEFFTHIYSSFCLQWLNNEQIEKLLQNLYQICKPNGVISFCYPIDGSFLEFHDANTNSDCNFRFTKLPLADNIYNIIEKSGFTVKYSAINDYKGKYQNAISFLKSIKDLSLIHI